MIIDLKENSGLGLRFDPNKPEMSFAKDLPARIPAIRTIDQMQEVLLEKNVSQPKELYYMYRDIYRISDKPVLEKFKLRFDVTAIKPVCLGKEFMKTAGHYHPESFPELYEVVYGRCLCLVQRPDSGDHLNIQEVIIAEAVAGQKIVIPPGFGHILINPGPDYLITSNWVSSCFASRYELYQQAEGAAYFVTTAESDSQVSPYLKINLGVKKNLKFRQVADINFVRPVKQIKKFGLIENIPMYNIINQKPELLDFLNHPLDYDYGDVFI
ncbi:MAG: glucose-6-phosphate isomerase family protein [Candidatus Omnitrophota bacterium]|jgi:glucose-6-phosphate isomerase